MAGECELGVTGLATMGANLARNAAGNGFPVAVHNRTGSRTRELLERHGDEGELVGTFSTEEFVAALEPAPPHPGHGQGRPGRGRGAGGAGRAPGRGRPR